MLTRLTAVLHWPLWYGAFRPFFLLTALSALVFGVATWGVFTEGWQWPGSQYNPIVWHGHAMMQSFVMASMIGFLMTAIPEFTHTSAATTNTYIKLILLWLMARLAAFSNSSPAILIGLLSDSALLLLLLAFTLPRLKGATGKAQRGFGWSLVIIWVVLCGFYLARLVGTDPLAWLRAQVGVWMIMIVVAMSRISMRIVNMNLKDLGQTDQTYLARPPRRNLAIVAISLFTLAEFLTLPHSVQGWLALASAAAMLNLTNDWHLGRVLIRQRVLMLYSCYWMMVGGYAVIGYALLAGQPVVSAGRHLLMMGAMALSVFAVLTIAGRSHAGLKLDNRLWIPVSAMMLVAAALLRTLWPWLGWSTWVIEGSVLLWSGVWLLYLIYFTYILIGPRADGYTDASGPHN